MFAVAAVEGGVVFDGALGGAAGLGVIDDGAGEHTSLLRKKNLFKRMAIFIFPSYQSIRALTGNKISCC